MDEKELNQFLFPERVNLGYAARVGSNDVEIYFVTVCTHARIPLLANDRVHTVLRRLWLNEREWRVGSYVIMPDHLHLLIAKAARNSVRLRRWVGWWKRQSTVAIPEVGIAWQKNCWDTHIKTQPTLAEKWHYMQNNPVRSGLVHQACDWPFTGEIHRIG
jgi:REP element-mobilizing transposase RayT